MFVNMTNVYTQHWIFVRTHLFGCTDSQGCFFWGGGVLINLGVPTLKGDYH